MRKRKSDHRAPQAGGARVIFGATRARVHSAYRVPAARSHGALPHNKHPISRRRAACSPAFRGIWWPFALTLLLVEAALSAQRRSRRACSLASHTAHALAPHSCLPFLSPRDLQAGCGLAERGREGADDLRRPPV